MADETRENAKFALQVGTLILAAASAYFGLTVSLKIAETRTHMAERYTTKDEAREAHREIRNLIRQVGP